MAKRETTTTAVVGINDDKCGVTNMGWRTRSSIYDARDGTTNTQSDTKHKKTNPNINERATINVFISRVYSGNRDGVSCGNCPR